MAAKARDRSMERHVRQQRTLDGITEAISYWIGEVAYRHAWTAKKISEFRWEKLYGNPAYSKLNQRCRGEIDGWWECIYRQHQRRLFWTHVLDGQRLTTSLHDDLLDGRWHEVNENSDWSGFCYGYRLRMKGEETPRLVFIPYSEALRSKETCGLVTEGHREMSTPRLSEDLINQVVDWARHGNSVEYIVPNGKRGIRILDAVPPR